MTASTYKEWNLVAFFVLTERVLNANLGQEHLLSGVVGGILDDLEVFPDYKQNILVSYDAITERVSVNKDDLQPCHGRSVFARYAFSFVD